MNILEASNVTKNYAAHKALNDVSISIPKQSIFGLLGPNGAGKTTLIRIINQIIMADEGDIVINGEKLHPKHIQVIGYLPEERGLYKKMKVGEQLMYLAQLKGLSTGEARKRIKHWLEKLGLTDWAGKKVEDLSKGMAQKIQFIATVLHEPELLILDEPFSGFDPVNANLIKDEIFELREKGATVIFSTHRMESVEQLCDDIALINKSQKILDGTKKDIKNSFKAHKYSVSYKGELNGLSTMFNVLESQQNDGLSESLIQARNGESPNELLKDLIQTVEVHSFVEVVPSINDIFIEIVEGGKS
ncbi:ABC-2 type transport system ATP-binding protein [Roseivirga pacifica]|uniref:ABC-2 type transport system ATP-binding protein n=1 Tax=Roseivirga pacifica TaxID=1267423 RepID=A0A1I0NGK0_9BACT|nr:ABC transporter ATP-binding protein [Roseivirga pacifica]MCO6359669.1 ATP-binding cassette domain-containing protein [Roseivirga pacifica]MCO6367039.1 ATP-binding cassette domain-containing protein [Roseivirga pacifica]MCO6370429.1 ATP-binding cassette domain-containing protein [Roseivirga pacifica]MCO6374696.1 ATP-binding cassette domain-containing protein [Roseivirga pacifica]MCO6379954.1 ATP-binding cassette domain-containing protein [Roseivirga pacifica]